MVQQLRITHYHRCISLYNRQCSKWKNAKQSEQASYGIDIDVRKHLANAERQTTVLLILLPVDLAFYSPLTTARRRSSSIDMKAPLDVPQDLIGCSGLYNTPDPLIRRYDSIPRLPYEAETA